MNLECYKLEGKIMEENLNEFVRELVDFQKEIDNRFEKEIKRVIKEEE